MLFPFQLGFPCRATRPAACRLQVERLEDRDCPSGGEQLFVASFDGDSVLRYDGINGGFIDTFVRRRTGGLNQPYGMVFGPHDGDLYVSTGEFGGPGQIKTVLRFDGETGAFIENFARGGDLKSPRGIIFGPDGNLYVADRNVPATEGRVARYDGRTGAYLGDFVPLLSGGLLQPTGLVFGPSGRGPGQLDLYVSNQVGQNILRYDGRTGAFLGEFVTSRSGGLESPGGLVFGPDGNLYVAMASYVSGVPKVVRFHGPAGPTPGAFIDTFVPTGSGGLERAFGLLFGPDGNNDGHFDLYVITADTNQGALSGKNGAVKRYDGVTGAFLDTFVPERSQGLGNVGLLTFTRTDPVTLAYRGGRLTAAALPLEPVNETLSDHQVQPLLAEAVARWQAADAGTSRLRGIDVRIADLGGATLGHVVGQTIWLDDDAAGWGWFVDPTPWDDAEFTTPGDQGEAGRMDLLSVLMHEVGHVLGHDHAEDGVMAETLSAGTRSALGHDLDASWAWLGGDAFCDPPVTDEGMPWLGKNRRKG